MVAETSWKATGSAALLRATSAAFVAMFCDSTASLVPSLHEAYWAPIAVRRRWRSLD